MATSLRDRPAATLGFVMAAALAAALEPVGVLLISDGGLSATLVWVFVLALAQASAATVLQSGVARQSLLALRRGIAQHDATPFPYDLSANFETSSRRLLVSAMIVRTILTVIAWAATLKWWLASGTASMVAVSVLAVVTLLSERGRTYRPLDTWLRLGGADQLKRELGTFRDLRMIGAEEAAQRRIWRRLVDAGRKFGALWAAGALFPPSLAASAACAAFASAAVLITLSGAADRTSLFFVAARLAGCLMLVAVDLRHVRQTSQPPAYSEASGSSLGVAGASGLLADRLRIGMGGRLRSVSFHAPPRTILALRVRSHEERLRMVEVLTGLHPPVGGDLTLNGESPICARAWRLQCALIPARTLVLRGSLRDNLSICAPNVPNRLLRAALIACAPQDEGGHFARRFDDHQEPSTRLTTSDLRVLSFARALIRRSELLIVEAPWPAADGFDQDHTAKLLRLMSKNRIVLIVTSGEAGCKVADAIVRLDYDV